MAISYTVSYTFSPSTTISSSQVNTNFSDNANTWNGLEALTKSFAKLKIDVDPSTALEVATKQYVDHYSSYRRPVLVTNSSTVVNIESGLDGTSGDVVILFPDGNLRTDSTTGRVQCNLAQVAALSGTWQSGLRTGAVANNTWYAVYAVKTSDNTSHFVAVADTVLPVQASFATLNSNFGTSSWVYLGLVRNGDGSASPSGLINFVQTGNTTLFINTVVGAGAISLAGIQLTSQVTATNGIWNYASGTGSLQVPSYIKHGMFMFNNTRAGGASNLLVQDASAGVTYFSISTAAAGSNTCTLLAYLRNGIQATANASSSIDINLSGFADPVLGVGSNPIL
jgi:hypothetical protein